MQYRLTIDVFCHAEQTSNAGKALAEQRARGMGELGATREEAAALAGWRGPLAPDEGRTADGGGAHVAEPGPREA